MNAVLTRSIISAFIATFLWSAAFLGDSGASNRVSNDAASLAVTELKLPLLKVPRYRTSGTYPQVSANGLNLKAVNAAIRNTVLDDQRRFARLARRQPPAPPQVGSGIYSAAPESKLISASTVVVSALIPATRLFPGGTDGQGWLSVTIDVPRAARVNTPSMFAEPSRGLTALGIAVRKRVVSSNRCVRDALNDRVLGRQFAAGFAPTASHYRYFALTPTGLAVGFPIGQVASPVCNRVQAVVPYSVVRPYLSALGEKLVAGVRQPR